jgi:hypothetical protein
VLEDSPRAPTRWRIRLILVLIAVVVLPAGATLLYHVPPGEGSFYPPCLFHLVTGLHCPGCGGTRCTYALLHGDVPQALAYNPLFVISLPLILFLLAGSVFHAWTGRRWSLPRLRPWAMQAILWAILAYWVLRNIPVFPLTLLAPHQL